MRRGYGRAGVARQNVHCGTVAEFDVAVSKELKGRRLGLRSNTLRRQLKLGIVPFTADDHWSTPRRVAGGVASKTLQMSDLRHPSKIFGSARSSFRQPVHLHLQPRLSPFNKFAERALASRNFIPLEPGRSQEEDREAESSGEVLGGYSEHG